MEVSMKKVNDKNSRASASQFFVAAELCRLGYVAVVTMGNTPNTDILCSNTAGTKFVHIQVKTYIPGNKSVIVNKKAENDYGKRFVWVLAGIPKAKSNDLFEYFIIPSSRISKHVKQSHQLWLKKPGRKGQSHKDSNMRIVVLPPGKDRSGWSVAKYKNNWSVIEKLLN